MNNDSRTTPLHLTADRDGGFAYFPALTDHRGRTVSVYESAAAEGPHLWLKTSDRRHDSMVHLHLDAEMAWKLADQLREAVRNHYQGDGTPAWAREDLA